ncbi:MAG: hypothetical protein ACR2LS_07400 [Thermomicrobiales bacterium]
MRTTLRGFGLLVMLAALMVSALGSASAAHNGNNKANLSAMGDDAAGKAIVNYSEGRGTFNGTIVVRDLEPNTGYTFVVRLMDNEATDQVICSGTSNDQGLFRCNEQGLALAGFSQAVVEDDAGNDAASGTFARRGNCRDPQQGGSQCESLDNRNN